MRIHRNLMGFFLTMKDPAFLFYSSDFLTGTMFMTNEQVGKYIRLLCAQHQIGALTKEHMSNICGTYDKDIWAKFEQDSDGNFFNERLRLEVDKRRSFCESRRKNRNSKPQDKNEKHMSQHMSTHMYQHMENENENENRIVNRKRGAGEKPTNPFSESFIEVWEIWKDYKKTSHRFSYKTIDSENIALAQLAKTSQGNEEFAIEMIHHSIAQGYKGIFAPDKSKQQTNGTKIQLTSKFEQWLNKA